MKVREVGREQAHAAIADDERVAAIVDVVRQESEMLSFILHVIREFHSLDQLQNGRHGGGASLRRFLELQLRKAGRTLRRLGSAVAVDLEGLYRDYDPGRVRGTLLEALVEDRLRGRYSAPECLLTNNLVFELLDGEMVVYASGMKSIDVIGFDGAVGECHDCKVDPSRFCKAWIEELEDQVAPHGFRIGLATAFHGENARRRLRASNINLKTAQLLDAGKIFDLTPLQPPRLI